MAVEIEIKAIVDKAIADLQRVGKAVEGTGTSSTRAGAGIKNFASNLNNTVQKFTGLNLATIGWIGAAMKVVDITKRSIDNFIEYSNQIQDISRLTGESAEDMSRLVQVGDDVRLTYDQMKTSMQIASRQGIDVSIDGIKRLSAEYLDLEPGLERTQFLLKTFGRSGAEMGRLLEMGADGIDKATAAVQAGLVMDEKAIAKAEKLRLAKDALSDSATALGNQLAGALVPALASVVEGLVGAIGAGERFIQWISNQVNKNDIANRSVLKLSGTYEEYRDGLEKSAKANGYLIDESGNLVQSITYQGQTTHKLIRENYAYTEQAWKTIKAQQGLNDMAADGIVYFGDLTGSMKRLAEQEAELAMQAAAQLSEKLSGQMDLTLKLTDMTATYTEKMDGLTKKHGELEEELANLNLNFPWDKEGIAEAEQALQDNQDEIEKTADAYEGATRRIVWDMMVAKLSIDGYTQAEFDWAMQAGVDMGIITQESADLAVALMADAEKEIRAFEDTQTALAGLKDWIDRLESKEIYVRTVFESQGNPPPAGAWQEEYYDMGQDTILQQVEESGIEGYRAGGGAMRPGGWYGVGENGPEPVKAGYGGYVSTTNNYNMTINQTGSSVNDVIFGFRTMQLLGA